MADGHNTMIAGILLAVVAVGIAGLYFTMSASPEATVIYTSYGGGAGGGAPSVSRPYSFTRPFTVLGRGLTGLSSMRSGTGVLNLTGSIDLRMPKNTIICTGQIFQDSTEAHLYTCGDANNTGGSIDCDALAPGGTGSSLSDPTNSTTCSSTQNNGAFLIQNHGVNATLLANLTNVTLSGIVNNNITFDNTLYNCVDKPGCAPNCNLCPAPNTTGCFKELPGGLTGAPQNITECRHFLSSTPCACECFSIHITQEEELHRLRAGDILEFVVKKTFITPAATLPC